MTKGSGSVEADLGEHFEAFILHEVASGRYADADAVVQAALAFLEKDDKAHRAYCDALTGAPS